MNIKILAVFLFSITTSWAVSVDAEKAPDIVGTAFSIDDGKPIYLEKHYFDSDTRHRVDYTTLEGEVFADKELNYNEIRYQPDFKQKDLRHKISFGSKITDKQVELYRKKKSGNVKYKSFETKPYTVVDAGFVVYIQENWDRLLQAPSNIQFALAKRLTTIKLTVSSVDLKDTPLRNSKTSPSWLYFKCEAKSAIIGLFMKPIYLAFDENKQLQVFHGLSNINNDKNKPQQVSIHYSYRDEQ